VYVLGTENGACLTRTFLLDISPSAFEDLGCTCRDFDKKLSKTFSLYRFCLSTLGGILSGGRGGFCPTAYRLIFWGGGFCPRGFCPGVFCPGGLCPGDYIRDSSSRLQMTEVNDSHLVDSGVMSIRCNTAQAMTTTLASSLSSTRLEKFKRVFA